MPVLVTCNIEENPIKTKGAMPGITFFPLCLCDIFGCHDNHSCEHICPKSYVIDLPPQQYYIYDLINLDLLASLTIVLFESVDERTTEHGNTSRTISSPTSCGVRRLCITKTCLFKYNENFTTKKWKFSDKKFWYFSYFCSKRRLWVLLRTASTRWF